MLRGSGVETGSMDLPGPIITMVAQGSLLAIVYAVVRSLGCACVALAAVR